MNPFRLLTRFIRYARNVRHGDIQSSNAHPDTEISFSADKLNELLGADDGRVALCRVFQAMSSSTLLHQEIIRQAPLALIAEQEELRAGSTNHAKVVYLNSGKLSNPPELTFCLVQSDSRIFTFYTVHSGNHRVRALRQLGCSEVETIVRCSRTLDTANYFIDQSNLVDAKTMEIRYPLNALELIAAIAFGVPVLDLIQQTERCL
jgi:hypothetical protein